jgi:hypothetical protein
MRALAPERAERSFATSRRLARVPVKRAASARRRGFVRRRAFWRPPLFDTDNPQIRLQVDQKKSKVLPAGIAGTTLRLSSEVHNDNNRGRVDRFNEPFVCDFDQERYFRLARWLNIFARL